MNIYTEKDIIITEEKPTLLIYCLQCLQGQCCGTHLQISILKLLRKLEIGKFWVLSLRYF